MDLNFEQKQELIKAFYLRKGLKEKYLKYVEGDGVFHYYEDDDLVTAPVPISEYKIKFGINPEDFTINFMYGQRHLTPKENIF